MRALELELSLWESTAEDLVFRDLGFDSRLFLGLRFGLQAGFRKYGFGI